MKKLTSIISLALALLASPFVAGAQEADEVTLLTVNLKDGQKEQYNLPDKPAVTFDRSKVSITSASVNGEYDFADVSHFSFDKGKPVSSIDDIKADDAAFTFFFTDNATVVIAAGEITRADLFDIQGRKLLSADARDGVVTLDVTSLPEGIYLVAPSCHKAVKIIKH